jgi:hydrogenase expression/formation protein HypE
MIIEEGLSLELLEKVLLSIAATAQQAEVVIVAGDTKVVPRGKVDGLFITTSGLGECFDRRQSKPNSIVEGDAVVVTGPIGRHGMAIMAAREPGFAEQEIVSDCGLLYPAVSALYNAGVQVRAMRDATRGGVAAVLHEWASDCGLSFTIEEKQVPVDADVRGIAELLGIDPLLIANEGTMVIAVPESEVEKALDVLRQTDIAAKATRIGYAKKKSAAAVCVRRGLGIEIALDEPSGAPLPRIC